MNDEVLGNLTSTVKTILLLFAGWCIGYFVSVGLDFPFSAEQLSEVFFMVLCLVWSYLDMKYPNKFRWLHKTNNVDVVVESEADLINEEYYAEEEYE